MCRHMDARRVALWMMVIGVVGGLLAASPGMSPALAQDGEDGDSESGTASPAPARPSQPAYLTRRDLTPEEEALVWDQLIPGIAGSNTMLREQYRRRLVGIGLPMVKVLVECLDTPTLMRNLRDHEQLFQLRQYVRDDLNEWFQRHASELNRSGQLNTIIARMIRHTSHEDIYNTMRDLYRQIDEHEDENLPRPEVLNSLRAMAVLAIGEIGDVSAGPVIARQLTDESIEVVQYTIQALGIMRAPYRLQDRIYPFATHENMAVRSRVWTALRRMDARESVWWLIRDLAEEEDENHRHYIVEVLEGITRQRFGHRASAWTRWWREVGTGENPLELQQVFRDELWTPEDDD